MRRIIKRERKCLEKRKYTLRCMAKNVNAGHRMIPSLYLCGEWMKRAGFQVNDKVLLTVYDTRLVIRRLGTNLKTKNCFFHAEVELFA
jgi:hypothetical protein